MTSIKPLICGISGSFLTEEEKTLITKVNPLGFVVFKKNLFDRAQALNLTNSLREILGKRAVPILIDQEGGKVLRLKKDHWRQPPSSLELGKFAYLNSKDAIEKTKRLVYLNGLLIGMDMAEIGVNVNCTPVADLLIPGAHHITSTRSFGPDPLITAELVNSMAEGMKQTAVQPIIKHMIGQGRAKCDSHADLPVVDTALEILENNDFKVFKLANHISWGMPAHIIYQDLDSENMVTYSNKSIDYIRNIIGFKGILISDCLTMKALPETWGQKASKAIAAGLDLVLYGSCNHNVIAEIADNIPYLPDFTWEKIKNSLKKENILNHDYSLIIQEYNDLLNELESEILSQKHSRMLKFILTNIEERSKADADYSSPLYRA